MPDERDGVFIWITVGLFGMSALGLANHFFALREFRTHTRLDALFERHRRKLVREYLRGKNRLTAQLPAAMSFGLWGVASFLLVVADRAGEWVGGLAAAIWLAGIVPVVVVMKRMRSPIPDQKKPLYLIEAERSLRGPQ